MDTVHYVDLERFMGDWYVIASVPTFFDKAPFNAIERYGLNSDGSIATTYLFHDGGPDGPKREMTAKARVRNRTTNAEWGIQFVWPIRADYRIVYLESDYSVAIVARKRRDFVWIMAREPALPADRVEKLLEFAVGLGYDRDSIRLVPHGASAGEMKQLA